MGKMGVLGGVLGDVLGGVIGGVSGIAQSAIDAKVQRENTDKTIAANKALAEYSYSKDLEMWNKANDYNSPAQQMSRYQSAGLNPNLIYGSGSSAGNTATTLPKFNAPTLDFNYKSPFNLASIISQFQDFSVKQAQIDNLREQHRILSSEADMKYYDSLAYGQQNDSHGKTDSFSSIPLIKRENILQNLQRTQADALRIQTDTALKQIQLKWMSKLGVTGLGGVINAASNIAKFLK